MNRREEKRENRNYQQKSQLSEVGDLISSILGVLCDPCNFTTSRVIACDFHWSEMIHQGTVRIPAAHRKAEYKVPTKTAAVPGKDIFLMLLNGDSNCLSRSPKASLIENAREGTFFFFFTIMSLAHSAEALRASVT